MSTTDQEYASLPKIRRLAVFLTLIGPESAASILRSFDDLEIEAISRELVGIELIDEDLQAKVIGEFSSLLIQSIGSIRGGYEVALKALEIARGSYHARNLVGKMEPSRDSRDVIEEISEMDARQIANLIKAEQPQTIAFLMGAMDAHKVSDILQLLDQSIRSEVIIRMGTLDPTPSSILDKVVKNISRHIDARSQQPMSHFGGADKVAQVLNLVDKNICKSLLSDIEEGNAQLGAVIRQKMFSFNDLATLSTADMQRVMREVDSTTLVMAMKPASAVLKEMIFNCLSKRAAEALKEELSLLGSVRLKEVEAAQDAIIQSVRKLEEEGEISIGGKGNNEYV